MFPSYLTCLRSQSFYSRYCWGMILNCEWRHDLDDFDLYVFNSIVYLQAMTQRASVVIIWLGITRLNEHPWLLFDLELLSDICFALWSMKMGEQNSIDMEEGSLEVGMGKFLLLLLLSLSLSLYLGCWFVGGGWVWWGGVGRGGEGRGGAGRGVGDSDPNCVV